MSRSLAASAFLVSHRVFRLIHGSIQILFEGIWMGLLPEAAVDMISELSYEDGRQYSSDSYLDSGLQFFEQAAIGRFFKPCKVLVAAAGAGREVIALNRAGYQADGFDCSRAMVEAGQQALKARNLPGRLQWAPPCRAPEVTDVYDALVVGWNGYTYIAPRDRRLAFLRSLSPHLSPGAPVLISCAAATGAGRNVWIPRVANLVRRWTLRPAVFEAGAAFPGRPRHSFSRNQLQGELTEAGFECQTYYKWGDFCAVVAVKSSSPSPPIKLSNRPI